MQEDQKKETMDFSASASGPPLLEEPRSVYSLLAESAVKYAEEVAVSSLYQHEDGRKDNPKPWSWTYAQLLEKAETLASVWASTGISKHSRVVTLLPNCMEYALALWTTACLGATFSPLDLSAVARPEELEYYLTAVNPDVLIVENEDVVCKLEERHSNMLASVKLKICLRKAAAATEMVTDSRAWKTMSELGQGRCTKLKIDHADDGLDADMALIIFTSGTTGQPKGCPHTSAMLSAGTFNALKYYNYAPGQRALQNFPNNHVPSYYGLLSWWRFGLTVLIPSPAFDAQKVCEILSDGLVTNMSVVPRMFTALITHPSFPSEKVKGLEIISTGAAMVPGSFIAEARERLGAKYTNAFFGLSEGNYITGWYPGEEITLTKTGIVSAGKPSPGTAVKICDSVTKKILQRGEIGELHISGKTVIHGYLAGRTAEFYKDSNGVEWFATGDEASLDNDDVIHIHGRFKDIIIRGGKNLSPAAMELALQAATKVVAQVIGINDEIAGEVPVAVLQCKSENKPSTKTMQDAIRRVCGQHCQLAEYFTLQDLGLTAYPTTSSGKVKKAELKKYVNAFLEKRSQLDKDTQDTSEGRSLLKAWSSALAQTDHEISKDVPLGNIADSITIARLSGLIRRSCGVELGLKELRETTFIEQLQLVSKSHATSEPKSLTNVLESKGAPGLFDIVHVQGSPNKFDETRRKVDTTLKALGLTWEDDVGDLYPVPDFCYKHLMRKRRLYFNLRLALIVKGKSVAEVRSCLETSLFYWSTYRALVVDLADDDDNDFCFVEIKPSPRFWSHAIREHGSQLADDAELKSLARDGLQEVDAQIGGPLFISVLAPVGSSDTGIVISVNHCVCDAITLTAWIEDLEHVLRTGHKAIPRVPYKPFADAYYNGRTSMVAQTSTAFFTELYRGIHHKMDAVWPLGHPDDFYYGFDKVPRQDGISCEKPVQNGMYGERQDRSLTILPELRAQYGIAPVTVVKTAFALFCILQTGKDVALFGDLHAARHWPFLPKSVESTFATPDPMDITGCTYVMIGVVFPVARDATIASLFQRISTDQEEYARHAQAPYTAIHGQLPREDVDTLLGFKRKQNFNWLPHIPDTSSEQDSIVKAVQLDRYFPSGLMWMCGLASPSVVKVQLCYDDSRFMKEEVERYVRQLLDLAEWIHRPENFERTVAECLGEVKVI